MSGSHFTVEVQSDHLEKLASTRPVQAVSELIWNAVDADATRVEVEIDSTDLGMSAITVRDNGHGIPYDDVKKLFGRLGGSWKAHGSTSKTKSRMLHGKEGRGRFKALGLGRVADWNVTLQNGQGYSISLFKDNMIDVRVSDLKQSKRASGVEVTIKELYRDYRSLQGDEPLQELSETFALYLSDYSEVEILYNGDRLDPSTVIASRQKFDLSSIEDDGEFFDFKLELIEWKSTTTRNVYLCTEGGFPLLKLQPRFHTPGFHFSAYIKSKYISKLSEEGMLELAEMNTRLMAAYEEAQHRVKEFFNARQAEIARTEIEQWKQEKVYPYIDEPQTSVEAAERKVFDIVALNVNKLIPEFSESGKKNKAFQLRMLRQAIERGPEELQHILNEVLNLPQRKQAELSKLLEEADLANIIGASKLVSDRLKFLTGLETLLFDSDLKKHFKERSQLHKILAENNTWVFGEEFNLTVDDKSLTEVLRKHQSLLGNEIVIDKPVTRVDGRKGIVDLMLSRSVPRNRSEELEHLVVELKRPTVKVGSAEVTQIKQYAYAVAADERFRHLDVRWSFWVLSNELDEFAAREARQMGKPKGQIFKSDDGQIEVWVKTWAEVLNEAKSRMRFVQNHLQANIDAESSLRYLQSTYEKYLSGSDDDDDPEASSGGGETLN